MLNLDVGGEKHRRDFGGKWQTLDINTKADYVCNLNLQNPLPFKDNLIDNIYCSDTLEHIKVENITHVLREFHRVLKLGGKCRIVVPDCAYAIDLYINNPKELANKKYCSKPGDMPSTRMGHLSAWFHTNKKDLGTGHKIGFDEELLKAFIARTNFNKVEVLDYSTCSPIFKGKDYERYSGWSLYFELTK